MTDERKSELANFLNEISKHISMASKVIMAAEAALTDGKVQAELMIDNLHKLKVICEECEEVASSQRVNSTCQRN